MKIKAIKQSLQAAIGDAESEKSKVLSIISEYPSMGVLWNQYFVLQLIKVEVFKDFLGFISELEQEGYVYIHILDRCHDYLNAAILADASILVNTNFGDNTSFIKFCYLKQRIELLTYYIEGKK